MGKVRVLLVDDSAVVRRLVTVTLNANPDVEVVGTAGNGRIALSRLADLAPDVVLLDLEMPEMDGLETLIALRKDHPRLPVIMFSRHTQRGVEATVQALTLGADDYVPKPGDGVGVALCVEELLIPKIKLLARRGSPAAEERPAAAPPPPAALQRQRPEVVVIGASTGGPNALTVLLAALPPDFQVPVVIVQHMPAVFTARLAERLAEKTGLRVREGAHGEMITAAQVWVAPGGHHLLVQREGSSVRVALNDDAPVNSCRPAVDVLFRSAADVYGPATLAVVLTGMGEDGLQGCKAVHAAGGQVLAQDEATSVVWSMPGAVAKARLADEILPLEKLGPEVVRRVSRRASRDSRYH
jgi:two-component system chemotaxis response regulator CheB